VWAWDFAEMMMASKLLAIIMVPMLPGTAGTA